MFITNILSDGTICKDMSKIKISAEMTKRFNDILSKGLKDDKTGKA